MSPLRVEFNSNKAIKQYFHVVLFITATKGSYHVRRLLIGPFK